MAKGARASTRKANNSKLKSRVFGPVETARTERLSAKLLELASQPKPKQGTDDLVMESQDGALDGGDVISNQDNKPTEEMEVDQDAIKFGNRSKSKGKGGIEKRKSSRKASIVFPRYKNGRVVAKAKGRK